MEEQLTIKTSVDQKADQIKAILYLLQTHTEEFKAEIDRAYALLKVGEKTDLSNKIEKIMDDPLSNIFQISSGVDTQAKELIDRLVKSFLNFNKEIIRQAFRTKTFFNDLHYSIVLREDNLNNREKMFEFFEKYDLLEIADRFPVYLQFVPIELISKIPSSEEIIINN
jgi:hypothetical protein